MKIQIVIQVDDEGRLSMEGAPNDAIVFYGVMEAAKDGYRAIRAQRSLERAIVPAGMPVPLSALRNGGRG